MMFNLWKTQLIFGIQHNRLANHICCHQLRVYRGRGMIRILILILSFTSAVSSLLAQEKDSLAMKQDIASMHFPRQGKGIRYLSSIGISMVQPPKDMIETALQAPLFNYHMNYTLPWKFSAEGDFSSLIVSNQLSMGPRFNLVREKFGFKVGCDLALVLGRLKQFGFDNSTKAWLYYPNISGSYKFGMHILTLKAEVVAIASVKTKTGENDIYLHQKFSNGYTIALYLEQRLHKKKVLSIGFKDSYVGYYWPAWLTFSTFRRYYHIPEISLNWIIK